MKVRKKRATSAASSVGRKSFSDIEPYIKLSRYKATHNYMKRHQRITLSAVTPSLVCLMPCNIVIVIIFSLSKRLQTHCVVQ